MFYFLIHFLFGSSSFPGNSVYVVPVFQSETIKGSFNALNPTPDIPSVLYPGSPMGTRPFYAQVGMGIVPPSFVYVSFFILVSYIFIFTTPSLFLCFCYTSSDRPSSPTLFSHFYMYIQ